MKRSRFRSTLIVLSLPITLVVFVQAQQPTNHSLLLDTLLPDGEGKKLVADHCTRCHSAQRIRQIIADGQGGDERYWGIVVDRMMKVFNAPIASHDVAPIVVYLTKHFGASAGTDAGVKDIVAANPDDELHAFLPNDKGKALVTLYCTTCHNASEIRRNVSQRAGRNKSYWNTLVRRMITVWNAPIADEDIEPITSYLNHHFGTSWSIP